MHPQLTIRQQAVLRRMQAQQWHSVDLVVRRMHDEHPGYAAGWCEAARVGLALGRATNALAAATEAQRHGMANPALLDTVGNVFRRAGD